MVSKDDAGNGDEEGRDKNIIVFHGLLLEEIARLLREATLRSQ
jgi:hypothetical protein